MNIQSKSLTAFMVTLCSTIGFSIAQISEKAEQRKVIAQLLHRHNLQAKKSLDEPRLCSLTGTAIYTQYPQSSAAPEKAKKSSRVLQKVVSQLSTYRSSLNAAQISRVIISYKKLVKKVITRR